MAKKVVAQLTAVHVIKHSIFCSEFLCYLVRRSIISFFLAKFVTTLSMLLHAVCLAALEDAENMILLSHEFSTIFNDRVPSATGN